MIPLVNSLEEAIEHVSQPEVKEELQYQLRRHNEHMESTKALKDRVEELEWALEEAERDLEGANEAAEENEDAADDLAAIKLSLDRCADVITSGQAENYLNEIMQILGNNRRIVVSDEEYEKSAVAF